MLGPPKCRTGQRIEHDIRSVKVDELARGMILAQDVFTSTGILLIPKGLEVTPTVRLRLANIAANGGLADPIRVLIPPERPERAPY